MLISVYAVDRSSALFGAGQLGSVCQLPMIYKALQWELPPLERPDSFMRNGSSS